MEVGNVLLNYTIPEIMNIILEFAYKCHADSHNFGYCVYCMYFDIKCGEYVYMNVDWLLSGKNHIKGCINYNINNGNASAYGEHQLDYSYDLSIFVDDDGFVFDSDVLEELSFTQNCKCKGCDGKTRFAAQYASVNINDKKILESMTAIEFDKKYKCYLAIKNYKNLDYFWV